MNFRFLRSEFPWSQDFFLDFNTLTQASQKNEDFLEQLDSVINRSVRSIRKDNINIQSLPNLNTCVTLMKEFLSNLNEVHTSSLEALPDFDTKITPLLYKYVQLVVFQSRQAESRKEYELRVCDFLNSLSLHPSICMTTHQRSVAFLQRLLSDEMTDDEYVELEESHCHDTDIQKSVFGSNKHIGKDMNHLEQFNKREKNSGNYENDHTDEEKADQVNSEPTAIPETPLKSQPVCVGVAAIKGIMPFSAGCLFPLTPPATESIEFGPTASNPLIEIVPNFPTPSQTPLVEFQKKLRMRFPIPYNITPTEKKARRDVLRTIRSHRQPKPSSWNVVETTRSPTRSCNLRKQLFLDTDSCRSSAHSSSSQLALYLSPDEEKDYSKSFSSNDTANPTEENIRNIVSVDSKQNLSSGEENPKSLIEERHEESYTELKKTIEGNLMGCEASLSDIELMDEIESSLNLDDDILFMNPTSPTLKGENDAKMELLSTTTTPIYQIEQSKKVSVNSASKKTSKISEQVERRKSSRLAGIPLPLRFTSEPLPDERKLKATPRKQSTSNEADDSILASQNKKAFSETIYDLPKQIAKTEISIIKTTPAQDLADLPKLVSWQKVRLQIPSCWADMIEKHVKNHHPDEMIRFQEDTCSRWPTVYCNCAQAQQS